jgi:hypothetical protein
MQTDKLVFGCTTISFLSSREASLRLLAQVFDLGVIHFDTALAYGGGESERVLGAYIKGRRDKVLLTTKYGLAPPIANQTVQRSYDRVSQSRLRPALNVARRVRKALRSSLFSPSKIREGLETSLQSLGTDHVDYFLLHEATAAQAQWRSVVATLEQLVKEGKTRAFGLGSAYHKIGPFDESIPAPFEVLQFEHSPMAGVPLTPDAHPKRLVFTHSAIRALPALTDLIERDPALRREIDDELGIDVVRHLPGLLLTYSHDANPRGKVIFSTQSADRLSANVNSFVELCGWPGSRREALHKLLDHLVASSPFRSGASADRP